MDFNENDWITLIGEIPDDERAGIYKERTAMQVHYTDGTKVYVKDPNDPTESNCYYFSREIRLATEEEIKSEEYLRLINEFKIDDIVKLKRKEEFYAILGQRTVPEVSFLISDGWIPASELTLVCKAKNRLDSK